MRCLAAVLFVSIALPVSAQVVSRPTEAPIVTAENDSWYRLREPVSFAGVAYYPAGATVFFNGNVMVRTGHYHGVPLYSDTTLEPYSIIFVPIGQGLMQPYERVRQGELAGTSGSRTPSFPVRTTPERREAPMAAGAPAAAASPAVNARQAGEPGAVGTSGRIEAPAVVGTGGITSTSRRNTGGIVTARRAESNDGIWIQYMGARWISVGPAVPLRASDFVIVGEHGGVPVYARKALDEDRIYLPSAGGVVPFKLKE